MTASPLIAALNSGALSFDPRPIHDAAAKTAAREADSITGRAELAAALDHAAAGYSAAQRATREARDALMPYVETDGYGRPAATGPGKYARKIGAPLDAFESAHVAYDAARAAEERAYRALNRAGDALRDFRPGDPATVENAAEAALTAHVEALAEALPAVAEHVEGIDALARLCGLTLRDGNGRVRNPGADTYTAAAAIADAVQRGLIARQSARAKAAENAENAAVKAAVSKTARERQDAINAAKRAAIVTPPSADDGVTTIDTEAETAAKTRTRRTRKSED